MQWWTQALPMTLSSIVKLDKGCKLRSQVDLRIGKGIPYQN